MKYNKGIIKLVVGFNVTRNTDPIYRVISLFSYKYLLFLPDIVMSHESKRGVYSKIEYLYRCVTLCGKFTKLYLYLILFPNKLTGVIKLGNWNVLTCPASGPFRSMALTVLVTCPNSLTLKLLKDADTLSKLSVDELLVSPFRVGLPWGSWKRFTLDNDSAK